MNPTQRMKRVPACLNIKAYVNSCEDKEARRKRVDELSKKFWESMKSRKFVSESTRKLIVASHESYMKKILDGSDVLRN